MWDDDTNEEVSSGSGMIIGSYDEPDSEIEHAEFLGKVPCP